MWYGSHCCASMTEGSERKSSIGITCEFWNLIGWNSVPSRKVYEGCHHSRMVSRKSYLLPYDMNPASPHCCALSAKITSRLFLDGWLTFIEALSELDSPYDFISTHLCPSSCFKTSYSSATKWLSNSTGGSPPLLPCSLPSFFTKRMFLSSGLKST